MSRSASRFELNGRILVLNLAESTVSQVRYHTSIETFARVLHIKTASVDKWEVSRPDGVKLRYGVSEFSLVRTDDANTNSPIIRWMLEEMEDPFETSSGSSTKSSSVGPTRCSRTIPTSMGSWWERSERTLTFMGGVRREIIFRLDRVVVKTLDRAW